MGPRSVDRGIALDALRVDLLPVASMGPRSVDRGIMPGLPHNHRGASASMGPRSVDRGISFKATSMIGTQLLQWGRDQLIAELGARVMRDPRIDPLQWGRDQLIAELRRYTGRGYRAGCFNGAAI